MFGIVRFISHGFVSFCVGSGSARVCSVPLVSFRFSYQVYNIVSFRFFFFFFLGSVPFVQSSFFFVSFR